MVLEAVPNFEEKTTDILIKKDRFGSSGKKITVAFEKGKFVDLTEEHKTKVSMEKINKIAEDMGSDDE